MSKTNWIIIIIIVAVIGGYFLLRGKEQPSPSVSPAEIETQTKEIREIVVDASRFEYNPSVISVKKGERIKLIINNTDTLHGIRIPELGISGSDFVEFVGDKNGEFIWYCNNFCGDGHRQMQGTLIIE